ncbi:hypothetical protein KFL_000750020 [Klebsormidium nitens]|uniref:Uncharacterized protein n=1 Tax=Klebsormidium nitens TaxID=105231 RepID=A0A0U9HJ15_KLENI|nr:hypothetical protein KFL_000750020 [Klebsormidium nitens]|eukprot:GAQ81233.1 hypothetical protein KFL_000750020 [Klebsormidium nitens]
MGVWPRLKEIAVTHPEGGKWDHHIKDTSAAPFLSIRPRFWKPLVLTGIGEPRRLHLKELYLNILSEEELQRLAQMDLSVTETLGFGFSIDSSVALLREVLSPARLPALQTLELWFANDGPEEDDDEKITVASLGDILSGIPPIRSFSFTLSEESSISSIPLCSALAASLRHLEIDLEEVDWMQQPAFDFSPILNCRGLESLNLYLGDVDVISIEAQVLSIARECSQLTSLALRSRQDVRQARVWGEPQTAHQNSPQPFRWDDDIPQEAIYGQSEVQQLVKLAESIGSLGSISSLSVEGDFKEDVYLDPQLTKALAKISSLRVLKLGAVSVKRLHFAPLLACPSLVEVDLKAALANPLFDSYEKLYGHEVPSAALPELETAASIEAVENTGPRESGSAMGQAQNKRYRCSVQ